MVDKPDFMKTKFPLQLSHLHQFRAHDDCSSCRRCKEILVAMYCPCLT